MRLPFTVLLITLAATAQAGVTSMYAIQVPQSVVPGFTTNDILIDFTGILRGQQLILELTQGSIYQQQAFGTNTAPGSALFAVAPEIQYDTFVTIGGLINDGAVPPASQPVLVIGGAVDLQPGSTLKFDTQGLNIAWAPGTGIDVNGGDDYVTARITLSNDARGRLRYFGSTSAGTGDPLIREVSICSGLAGNFEGCGPFTVGDKTVEYTAVPPSTIVSETLPYEGAGPFGDFWSLESFESPNGKPASVDPETGLFTWDGFGSPEGIYEAVIRFTLDGGESDTGTLSIVWHVPEPTAATLFALGLVAWPSVRRKCR